MFDLSANSESLQVDVFWRRDGTSPLPKLPPVSVRLPAWRPGTKRKSKANPRLKTKLEKPAPASVRRVENRRGAPSFRGNHLQKRKRSKAELQRLERQKRRKEFAANMKK